MKISVVGGISGHVAMDFMYENGPYDCDCIPSVGLQAVMMLSGIVHYAF
jgi:hypothetical protein